MSPFISTLISIIGFFAIVAIGYFMFSQIKKNHDEDLVKATADKAKDVIKRIDPR